ncbi:spirocyclase AveC family protein [Nocardia bovistercoris]|uniref:Spirocyclase AveC family protein n=1 Tax=Nocardia bovistercoris TaxID=2785916 RepID=A0A931IAN2_9NOCA|nr:spirocyclase AveC family protein [Nocardia bovistercoris]MBH0776717.1 spirocyclase AveC family protein [Nocardia bovistercoris]
MVVREKHSAGPAVAAPASRRGAATVWAVVGAVWVVLATQAILRWVLSGEQFEPAPILGPDEYPVWREFALRALEVASLAVLTGFVWRCVLVPWRRDGRLSLDGKFVIGGLFGVVADGFLNIHHYLFAWNAHSVNRGVWTAFLPFHDPAASTRYAEGLAWGIPMYIYFCTGAAIVGCATVRSLRRRYPAISDVSAYSIVFAMEFTGGFLLENTIIRVTQAYGYAQTTAALTLFDGSQYQFPLYESLCTAALGVAFTYVRLSALESADGVSCVEFGYRRWPRRLHEPVRLLSVVGFSAAALLMLYHLPFNWFGVAGRCIADMPSYMLPG